MKMISDFQRVENWFESGQLLRPRSQPDLVDLTLGLSSLSEAEGLKLTPGAKEIASEIGEKQHIILLLIDGLGFDKLELCPEEGFLKTHLRRKISSVFPSTTSAALTSLATGQYPAQHGVLAWWLFLPQHQLTSTPLPFIDRFTGKDLTQAGVRPETLFKAAVLPPKMQAETLAVVPQGLVNSVYTNFTTGSENQAGYAEVADGFQIAADHANNCPGRSFTYLYMPQADSVAHSEGCSSPNVIGLMNLYDSLSSDLSRKLPENSCLLITGDHGQVDVSPENQLYLDSDSSINQLLLCPPSGERTVPFFHVKPGLQHQFANEFSNQYGEYFALLSTEEADQMKLFGPQSLSKEARERVGDFLAISPEATALNYRVPSTETELHIGVHSGLTPREMLIPLIVFKS
jgi:Type I phosphodiesterase / nucleotide pyrophosphatase